MPQLIAESKSWEKTDDTLKVERNQLADKKQKLGLRIANFTKAIGGGKCTDAIFKALQEDEEEAKQIAIRLEQMDIAIAQATRKRPTGANQF